MKIYGVTNQNIQNKYNLNNVKENKAGAVAMKANLRAMDTKLADTSLVEFAVKYFKRLSALPEKFKEVKLANDVDYTASFTDKYSHVDFSVFNKSLSNKKNISPEELFKRFYSAFFKGEGINGYTERAIVEINTSENAIPNIVKQIHEQPVLRKNGYVSDALLVNMRSNNGKNILKQVAFENGNVTHINDIKAKEITYVDYNNQFETVLDDNLVITNTPEGKYLFNISLNNKNLKASKNGFVLEGKNENSSYVFKYSKKGKFLEGEMNTTNSNGVKIKEITESAKNSKGEEIIIGNTYKKSTGDLLYKTTYNMNNEVVERTFVENPSYGNSYIKYSTTQYGPDEIPIHMHTHYKNNDYKDIDVRFEIIDGNVVECLSGKLVNDNGALVQYAKKDSTGNLKQSVYLNGKLIDAREMLKPGVMADKVYNNGKLKEITVKDNGYTASILTFNDSNKCAKIEEFRPDGLIDGKYTFDSKNNTYIYEKYIYEYSPVMGYVHTANKTIKGLISEFNHSLYSKLINN